MSFRKVGRKTKAKLMTAGLCNIILQNAIARFFNISSIVLTNAIREGL